MMFARRKALLCLMALLILSLTGLPLAVLAQDDGGIHIAGSGLVTEVISPLVEAYASEADIEISLETTSTVDGLDALCSGDVTIAAAASPITRAQEAACAAAGVEWVEVLLGYDTAVLAVNPTFSFADCLTLPEVTTLLAPSATDSINTWQQVKTDWDALNFELYLPAADSPSYTLLDSLLPGEGLRTDGNIQDSPADVVSAVAEDVAGVGLTTLSAIAQSEANVVAVALDALGGFGCAAPSIETIEDDSYPATRSLLLYVNAEQLAGDSVQGLVEALLGDDARTALADQGYTPTSSERQELVLANVTAGVTGREFTEGEPLFNIPLDVSGSVLVRSAAGAYKTLDTVRDAFGESYADVSLDLTAFGNTAAYRELCSGEVDMAGVTRTPTEDEAAACEEAAVSLWEMPLGQRAIVLMTSDQADYATCLTTDAVAEIWQDQGEATVSNWNELGEDFPDQALSILMQQESRRETDFILNQTSDSILNPRTDPLDSRNDPLWVATATHNVEGAISYLNYNDWLTIDPAEYGVQAVAIDAGQGCVAPTLETIRDGSYALSETISLQVATDSLGSPAVQSWLWYLLQDHAVRLMHDDAGLIPLDEDAFDAYQTEAAARYAALAEADNAATSEDSADDTATEEPTEEATEESSRN